MYAVDLVLCGESEEDLRVMVGRFAKVCRRKGLKVNAGKSKGIVLNGEEGLKCKVHVDKIRLEHVLEFKHLGCILDEPGTDEPEFIRKVTSRRRVAGAIRSLVNARDLHETLLVPVIMYGSETMRRRLLELGLYRCTTSKDC